MTVNLNSIPTTNTIEFRVTFLLDNAPKAVLAHGQAETLSLNFNAIGVGNSEPLSVYRQETPGNTTLSPGNLAFVDHTAGRKIALRYGTPDSVQQNIVFVLE
jgi:hypothetical protein